MRAQPDSSWSPEDEERAELLGILRQVVEREDLARKMVAVAHRERKDPSGETWVDEQLQKVADGTIWVDVAAEPDPKDFWNWQAQH